VAENNIFVNEHRRLILAVVVQLLQVHICPARQIRTVRIRVKGANGAPAISRGKSPRRSREMSVSPRDDMTKNCEIMLCDNNFTGKRSVHDCRQDDDADVRVYCVHPNPSCRYIVPAPFAVSLSLSSGRSAALHCTPDGLACPAMTARQYTPRRLPPQCRARRRLGLESARAVARSVTGSTSGIAAAVTGRFRGRPGSFSVRQTLAAGAKCTRLQKQKFT
jgi:hypothetical protein